MLSSRLGGATDAAPWHLSIPTAAGLRPHCHLRFVVGPLLIVGYEPLRPPSVVGPIVTTSPFRPPFDVPGSGLPNGGISSTSLMTTICNILPSGLLDCACRPLSRYRPLPLTGSCCSLPLPVSTAFLRTDDVLPVGAPSPLSSCWRSRSLPRAGGRSALPSTSSRGPSSAPAAVASSPGWRSLPLPHIGSPSSSLFLTPTVRRHVRGPPSGCSRQFCCKRPWAASFGCRGSLMPIVLRRVQALVLRCQH